MSDTLAPSYRGCTDRTLLACVRVCVHVSVVWVCVRAIMSINHWNMNHWNQLIHSYLSSLGLSVEPLQCNHRWSPRNEVGGRHKKWVDARLSQDHKFSKHKTYIGLTDHFIQRSVWTPSTSVHARLDLWLQQFWNGRLGTVTTQCLTIASFMQEM